MTNFDLYPSVAESAAEAVRLVRGVGSAPLDGPTPCADMDLHALLNHYVLYTAHTFELRALRVTPPEELLARDLVAEEGWQEAYAAQSAKAVAAWSDPAVWEGETAGMPAAAVAGMILAELVLHGWDVARATGQELRCSETVAGHLLKIVEENAEIYRQYEGFAEPVALPADAGTLDRALALSGRDPHWKN